MANTSSKSRSGNTSSRSQKTGSPKKSARTNTSGASRQTSSKGAPGRKQQPAPVDPGADSVLKKFASSRAAMPLIFIASVILITGIDLLISWNKYEMFFKILGVELPIAVVIWTVLTLVFSGRKAKGPDVRTPEDGE